MVAQRRHLGSIFGEAVQLQGGLEDEEPVQGRFETAQREGAEDEQLQMKAAPAASLQREAESAPPPDRSGLPDGLKTGIGSLSGMAMDHVQVHYNSSRPAQLNALAYAQGSDIHIAPGQERHLPHEAWHLVQQAQGRVKPTIQMKDGVPVNDEPGLEHEADVMGARASQMRHHEAMMTGTGDVTGLAAQRTAETGEASEVRWEALGAAKAKARLNSLSTQRLLIEAIHRSPRVVAQAARASGWTGGAGAAVQRLAIDDQPYPNLLSRVGLTIKKSGAGTTGVYFAAEGAERIVVKFLPVQEAFRAKVADAFMAQGTELRTPGSRILAPAAAGNTALRAAVRAHKHLAPPRVNLRLQTDVDDDTVDNRAVVLMEHVEQVSLQELARGRAGEDPAAERARLAVALANPAVASAFAKVMVVDAIVGNEDRFLKDPIPTQRVLEDPANISNIFLTPDLQSAVALDTSVERAWGGAADEAMNESRTRLVRYLAQGNMGAQVASTVIKSCLLDAGELAPATFPGLAYRALATPLAQALVAVEPLFAANLTRALDEEIETVGARLKRKRGRVKAAHDVAAAQAGIQGPAVGAAADYDRLRARAKMLEELHKGRSEAQAEAVAIAHLQHKKAKAQGRLPRQRPLGALADLFRGDE